MVQNVRVTFLDQQWSPLTLIALHEELIADKDTSGRRFATQFAVPSRSTVAHVFEFQHQPAEFEFCALAYRVAIEVLIWKPGISDWDTKWRELTVFHLHVSESGSELSLTRMVPLDNVQFAPNPTNV